MIVFSLDNIKQIKHFSFSNISFYSKKKRIIFGTLFNHNIENVSLFILEISLNIMNLVTILRILFWDCQNFFSNKYFCVQYIHKTLRHGVHEN